MTDDQPTDLNKAHHSPITDVSVPELVDLRSNPIGLHSQQLRAYIELLNWADSFNLGHASGGRILAGYAGTGKTFLVKNLVTMFRSSVALCAPTNKAVKELQRLGTGFDCCTIYSLLGLKMEPFEDTIRLIKAEGSRIHRYQYVVLDECGMIGQDLLEHILNAIRSGTRFLFVGDPKQLPPIGENRSKIWGMFQTSALTQVVRHDNQILELATRVRTSKLRELDLKSNNTRIEGVWHLNQMKFDERIRKFAANDLFASESKIVCWRNKTAEQYNHIVRHTLFGTKVFQQKYLTGDRLVFTAPFSIDRNINIFTDDEATVLEVVVSSHTDHDLLCYYLTLSVYARIITVKVIHEDSEQKFDKMLADFANEARRSRNGAIWRQFWVLKESMGYVKYAHALTAHRAQGSTYTNIFVDVGDILSNTNRSEAKKCLYVAVTRPTTKLFLTQS